MEAAEASSEIIVVYLHGSAKGKDLWYRVEVPMTPPKVLGKRKLRRHMPIKKINPVAKVYEGTYGGKGSWAVIGDNIYRIGEGDNGLLLKHNMEDPHPALWDIESSSMNIPRRMPFLAALGTKKQLCVVAGTKHCSGGCDDDDDDDDDDDCWSKCGEIYHLNNNTWTFLNANYSLFGCFNNTFNQAALVGKDDSEDPKEIVFYCLHTGSVLFLDVTSGTSRGPLSLPDFDLLKYSEVEPLPQDLDCFDLSQLQEVTTTVPAVFTNNTFYWFSNDLRLFGYDTMEHKWLQSPKLTNLVPILLIFPPFKFPHPVLVGLGNGKFLVIAGQGPGELNAVSLLVAREGDSLHVTVQLIQPLSVDDPSFVLFDGKAMLKNIG